MRPKPKTLFLCMGAVGLAGLLLGVDGFSWAVECAVRCHASNCVKSTADEKCYKINPNAQHTGTTCNFWWNTKSGCTPAECSDGTLNMKVRWEEQMSCSPDCDTLATNDAHAKDTCEGPQGKFAPQTCFDGCKVK